MPTLDDLIAAHHAAQPAPRPLNRPTIVLTERGHAAVAIIRLKRQLARLSAEDIHHVGLLIGAARDATA